MKMNSLKDLPKIGQKHGLAFILWAIFGVFILNSCSPKLDCNRKCVATGPVIVYKTKGDYKNLVSVALSADKSKITAYPAPIDAKSQIPVELKNGYLLKKMVGNAFLSLTIDDYVKGNYDQSKPLSDFIMDKDPFTEIYECCHCVSKDVDSINVLIEKKQLKYCKKIKKL